MLERFFKAKSFGLHISNLKHVPGNTILMIRRWLYGVYVSRYHGYVSWLYIMAIYHGYVSWLCIMAMYHGYVSRLCIMAMYHGYVYYIYIYTYILCIIKNDSSESKKVIFLKSALNLVLIADSESTQKSVQIRTGIIDS